MRQRACMRSSFLKAARSKSSYTIVFHPFQCKGWAGVRITYLLASQINGMQITSSYVSIRLIGDSIQVLCFGDFSKITSVVLQSNS